MTRGKPSNIFQEVEELGSLLYRPFGANDTFRSYWERMLQDAERLPDCFNIFKLRSLAEKEGDSRAKDTARRAITAFKNILFVHALNNTGNSTYCQRVLARAADQKSMEHLTMLPCAEFVESQMEQEGAKPHRAHDMRPVLLHNAKTIALPAVKEEDDSEHIALAVEKMSVADKKKLAARYGLLLPCHCTPVYTQGVCKKCNDGLAAMDMYKKAEQDRLKKKQKQKEQEKKKKNLQQQYAFSAVLPSVPGFVNPWGFPPQQQAYTPVPSIANLATGKSSSPIPQLFRKAAVILDSGCSTPVVGELWLETFHVPVARFLASAGTVAGIGGASIIGRACIFALNKIISMEVIEGSHVPPLVP